jgi:hypothetical protein
MVTKMTMLIVMVMRLEELEAVHSTPMLAQLWRRLETVMVAMKMAMRRNTASAAAGGVVADDDGDDGY